MRQCFYNIALGITGLLLTSCSWGVDLIIANISNKEIIIRYVLLTDTLENQFYNKPKTYEVDEKQIKLRTMNLAKQLKEVKTDYKFISQNNEVEIVLKPGQAVNVGFYASYQPRLEIISKHHLRVQFDKDSVITERQVNDKFIHCRNIRTCLLQIN